MSWFSDLTDKYVLKKAYKWGRGRARTKLIAFRTYSKEQPHLSKSELYYLTILTSDGFNEYTTQKLIDRAKEQADGYITTPTVAGTTLNLQVPKEPFCLRSVVKMMLSAEEWKLFDGKGFPHPNAIFEAWQAVDDTIPADL